MIRFLLVSLTGSTGQGVITTLVLVFMALSYLDSDAAEALLYAVHVCVDLSDLDDELSLLTYLAIVFRLTTATRITQAPPASGGAEA